MKKVGKLTEARMVLPPEPKVYPMVSDKLFEAKVKLKSKQSPARATGKSVQAESGMGPASTELSKRTQTPEKQAELDKKRKEWRAKLRPTGDTGETKTESSTPKPLRKARARAEAGKPLKKGTAKMVANDSGSEMGDRMKAAEKL